MQQLSNSELVNGFRGPQRSWTEWNRRWNGFNLSNSTQSNVFFVRPFRLFVLVFLPFSIIIIRYFVLTASRQLLVELLLKMATAIFSYFLLYLFFVCFTFRIRCHWHWNNSYFKLYFYYYYFMKRLFGLFIVPMSRSWSSINGRSATLNWSSINGQLQRPPN